MDHTFSPFKRRPRFSFPSFKSGNPSKIKKILLIVAAVLIGLWLIIYFLMGDLRFFMSHYMRLTFFRKHYIVLLQNNYELRPTGGFITAYGNLDTFMGFVTNLQFHNSYDLDAVSDQPAPYPQPDLLKNEWYQGYTFRDANWNPNFPGNVETLLNFYTKKFPGSDIDGIFVLNFNVLEKILEKTGPIKYQDKTLDSKSLFSWLSTEVANVDRHDTSALQNRKNILSEIAPAIISKIKWHPFATRDILEEALKSKDLYFWLRSGLQSQLEERDWANTLSPESKTDFLAVNLANLGSKKADRYVMEEIHHDVNLSKEIPEITTEVTLRYPGSTNSYSDNYKGYLRVLVPGGAEFTATPVDSRIENQEKLGVAGTVVHLPAGSKISLSYTYTLPRSFFSAENYALQLVKQSGSTPSVTVTVETPRDTQIQSKTMEVRENKAYWSGLLSQDTDLSASALPDVTPPYPIEQVFSDLKTISIYFNEPLDESFASNRDNFSIVDTNKTSPITDNVKVTAAEVIDASTVKLTVEGVSEQPLEAYQITLKEIRDGKGNVQSPNPKTITVIQRIK